MVDHLQTIKMIVRKATVYGVTIRLVFIDFTNTFDLLDHEFVLRALLNHALEIALAKLIEEIYTNLQAKIIADVEGESFKIRRRLGEATQSPRYYTTAP